MSRIPKAQRPPEPIHIDRHTVRAIVESGADEEGRWRWRIEWYVERKLKTKPLGRLPTSEVGAAAIAMIAGGLGPAPKVVAGFVATVDELLRAFSSRTKGRGDLSPETVRSYTTAIRHMRRTIGTSVVDPLHPNVLESHKDLRLREGASTAVVSLELRIFRMAWTWGRTTGILPALDIAKVPLKVKPLRPQNVPTPAQIRRVIGRLEGWARVGAVLLWGTGGRIREIGEATWGGLDEERAELRIAGKTGERVVPLEAPVLRVLLAWRDSQKTPPLPSASILGVASKTARVRLNLYLAEACADEGVARFTPKDVRAAVVNALFDAGVDPKTEADLIGHSDQVALAWYRRSRAAGRRDAVKRAGLGHLEVGEVRQLREVGGEAEADDE